MQKSVVRKNKLLTVETLFRSLPEDFSYPFNPSPVFCYHFHSSRKNPFCEIENFLWGTGLSRAVKLDWGTLIVSFSSARNLLIGHSAYLMLNCFQMEVSIKQKFVFCSKPGTNHCKKFHFYFRLAEVQPVPDFA